VGYARAILIDAQRNGGAPAGTVCTLSASAPPTRHGGSAHDVDLWTALAFGRQAGAALPTSDHVRIVAIEAADVDTFSEKCTPAVEAGIPRAAAAVTRLLTEWR
jgi:hydrogenase maturation protease